MNISFNNFNCSVILRRFFFQLLITLLFYLIIKFEFLIYNWSNWYNTYSLSEVLSSILIGLRFDWSSISTLSSVIFIAALIPWPFVHLKLKDTTLRISFFIIQLPFLIINTLDTELIHFTGRRFTTDSLFLIRELDGKMISFIGTYWELIIINLVIIYFYFNLIVKKTPQWIYNSNISSNTILRKINLHSIKFKLSSSLFALILMVISIRGGVQLKPISLAHIDTSDIRLSHLISNSSFTLLHSIQKQRINPKNYFSSQTELKKHLPTLENSDLKLPWSKPPKNVILFILESFGVEYMGYPNEEKGYTPFLDSLITKGLFYKYGFANGKRSIEALPSLLAGIPSLMDEPFLSSQYQSIFVPSLGKLLKEKNVDTYFFHGGKNGTMFFDEWIKRLQFTSYYGLNEFNDPSQFDGTWGIWDEPFLQFMIAKLNENSNPFLSVFFSLSSHHPFEVPAKYKTKFTDGPIPILKSIQYSDYSLKLFFDEAQKQNWYNNTLFIFTADHTSKSFNSNSSSLSQFHVPMLFYFPGANQITINPNQLNQPIQHIDIFPTLLDIFEVSSEEFRPLLAKSILRTYKNNFVSLYLDGDHWLIYENSVLYKNKNKSEQILNLKKELYPKGYTDVGKLDDKSDGITNFNMGEYLNSSIQYFNNGLIQNTFYNKKQ